MNFRFEQHTSEESLELYALGRLDKPTSAILEEHLLICDHCRAQLDEVDRYVHAMQLAATRLRRSENQETFRSAAWDSILTFVQMPFKWAAVGGMAVAMAVFVTVVSLPNRSPELAKIQNPISLTLVANRGEVTSAPANHILDIALDARGLDLGPHVRVDVVNSQGEIIETLSSAEIAEKIGIRTRQALLPGYYYVRIYASGSQAPGTQEMVREFGFVLK